MFILDRAKQSQGYYAGMIVWLETNIGVPDIDWEAEIIQQAPWSDSYIIHSIGFSNPEHETLTRVGRVSYTITISGTELKAWPYKVHISGEGATEVLQGIHDWLNSRGIKYQCSAGFWWYFNNEQDVMAFRLAF